jgi:hypothetical protein
MAQAQHEVRVGIGRSTVAVRFSRVSAAVTFADRFADMLVESEPGLVIYATSFGGRAHFWSSPERAWSWDRDPRDELVVFFADNVMMHEYLTTSADVGFHAALAGYGSSVLAIVGQSGAGKTTTAIALARKGFALYSDERCILQDGAVVPFLRAMTIRQGGRSALLATATPRCSLIDEKLRELPASGDTSIRPESLFGPSATGPPKPLSVVFLLDGRGSTPDIQPCSVYAALPTVLRSMMSSATGIERPARALRHLRHVPFFRLRLGAPDATAAAIERSLRGIERSRG